MRRVVSGVVLAVVLVFGLYAFFEVPTIHYDTSGRAYLLGRAIAGPGPACSDAPDMCHCLTNESVSAWLFGYRWGYIKVGGCP